MKKLILTITFQLILLITFSQNKIGYQIFDAKGKKVSYKKMVKSVQNGDIILFGELHNNPISHWLQYEVSEDLLKMGNLTFGAEMIEADNQVK